MLTDEELVSKYSKIPEIKYFLEKYPDANIEVDRSPYERYIGISFGVERQVDPPSIYTGIHSLGIRLYTNPYHVSLNMYCGKTGMTGEWGLSGISQVDEAEKECFQTSYREQQFTIVANRVNGMSLGICTAHDVDPQVVEEYWLLKDAIFQLDKADVKGTIVYRNINPNATTGFLIDNRLGFAQTCLEIICYDELSSFINLGDNKTSYMIRVFALDDPFHIVGSVDTVETGMFESENEVGEPIPVEVNDNGTKIEAEYNE